MEIYFTKNNQRLDSVSDDEWRIAISKCKSFIFFKLKGYTLFGAHTSQNLGENPVEYYLTESYMAIIEGKWEWKDKFTLAEQLIRIAGKKMSDQVEKSKTRKAKALKFEYRKDLEAEDEKKIEDSFYNSSYNDEIDEESLLNIERKFELMESVAKTDEDFLILHQSISSGMKRAEIAILLDQTPKFVSNLTEKYKQAVREFAKSNKQKSN